MPELRIYTSKKKSFLLLIGSLLFVIAGIYAMANADDVSGFRHRDPHYGRILGMVTVLFFGLGIYGSIKQLLKNQLALLISERGLNINPNAAYSEYIDWKNIQGFSMINTAEDKLIIIEIDNPQYWLDKEKNKILKTLLKSNLKNYGSPLNFPANSINLTNSTVMNVLNENFEKYKGKLKEDIS